MKREERKEALTDGSIPFCASVSLHVYRGFEPRDAQQHFLLTAKRHSPGPAKAKVVVVDHDLRVLKALGDLLSSAGYEARLFSTAEDFLANPTVEKTRCLIAGVAMPGTNGIDLLRRLKARGMELPCILLASHDDTDTALFCRTEGARFLLTKPVMGPELLTAVSLVTHSHHSSEQTSFIDAVRSALGRAGGFSGRPLVSRACSALFGREKTSRIAESHAGSKLHTMA